MAIYNFYNVYANKYLTICGTNVTSLSNPHALMLFTRTYLNEQRFSYAGTAGSASTIRATMNTNFGLNAYRAGVNWTCNLHTVSGNETDASIVMEQSGNYYKIRLTNYANRYLTAAGMTNGAGVYWAAATGGTNQLWSLHRDEPTHAPTQFPTAKSLSMPINVNQKYSGNPDWVQEYGCAVCCMADVASYYSPNHTPYTAQDMIDCGAASKEKGAIMKNAPYVGFNAYTAGSYLDMIKAEIAENRPVLVHCKQRGNSILEHWVVAFEYKNGAATIDDIKVLDPAGDGNGPVGTVRTLSAAMDHSNHLNYISELRMTYEK